MGSSPTLAHSDPTRDLEDISAHPALRQRTAATQLTTRDREAALVLGTRVAVASSRENDRNPVMWLASQDYRAADATRTARLQVIRQRHGPERLGPER
jgi:hypothetical protein